MNKFVKGAKNLVLALSFVSVCACGSVENADLNAVNKEFGRGGSKKNGVRRNVNHGVRRNVDNGNRESEKLIIKQGIVKSCIKENEINFDRLKKFGFDLSGCNFFVSKDYKILFGEKVVFDFSNFSEKFLYLVEMIIDINEYKGVLNFEEGFEKIRVNIGDNVLIFNEIEFGDVESCIVFIGLLGLIDKEVFNKLFVCEKLKISNGKINNKTFNRFWEGLNGSFFLPNGIDSDEVNMRYSTFLNGFSLFFGGKKCEFVKCDANGGNSNNLFVGIKVGNIGVVVLGSNYCFSDNNFYLIY